MVLLVLSNKDIQNRFAFIDQVTGIGYNLLHPSSHYLDKPFALTNLEKEFVTFEIFSSNRHFVLRVLEISPILSVIFRKTTLQLYHNIQPDLQTGNSDNFATPQCDRSNLITNIIMRWACYSKVPTNITTAHSKSGKLCKQI